MNEASGTTWKIKLLYDGLCPFCTREVAILRKRNAAGSLAFEDISADGFDASKYGLTQQQVIGSMHAVRSDGAVLVGVDAFAEIYQIVGWRVLSWVLRFPLTRPFAKMGYWVFAKIRPRFSRLRQCESDRCAR